MREKMFYALLVSFIIISSIVLISSSSKYRQSLSVENLDIRSISNIDYEIEAGEKGSLVLPSSLKNLSPNTNVTIRAEVKTLPGDSIFVKSVFAPMKLYINDILFYEYGEIGSYPPFLNDPPTGIAILKLPENEGKILLKAEYKSLSQRDTLSLPMFYIGDHASLLNRMLKSDGFSFLFSLILIFLGITMTIISLTFVRKIPSGMSFLWLGLFSLFAGIWVFGECDFASRLFPYPAFLYVLDYLGLFLVATPFLHFGLVVLEPKNKMPIQIMLWIHYFSLVTTLVLQLTGKVDFIKSLFWFHIITPLAFVVFASCLIWEGIKNKNPVSKRFAPATILLVLSVVLELANYWFRFTNVLTMFFQLGVLFFIISLGIISGYYVKESLRNTTEKQRLEYEMENIEKQLSLQRLQYQKMADDEERMKKERHDFRHHLTVLGSLISEKDKLKSYIDELATKSIRHYDTYLCENYIVNAVASYYYEMAKELGIDIETSLTVPRNLEIGKERDLCVIIGNLMENAVEACSRMANLNQAFIRINSSLNYNILTITIDNNHSGNIKKKNNTFLSSKHTGEGIGISSVIAMAKKHSGGTRFEDDKGIFKASVYLKIM